MAIAVFLSVLTQSRFGLVEAFGCKQEKHCSVFPNLFPFSGSCEICFAILFTNRYNYMT